MTKKKRNCRDRFVTRSRFNAAHVCNHIFIPFPITEIHFALSNLYALIKVIYDRARKVQTILFIYTLN